MNVIEIQTSTGWTPVCTADDLPPGRGRAALVDGEQIALFRTRIGSLYAVGNFDPCSGAYVVSRGIVGSRGERPVVLSPMYKQAFDLETGVCLDEEGAALPVYAVRAAP